MRRLACERLQVPAAMPVAPLLHTHGGVLTAALSRRWSLLATACERRTRRLRPGKVDHETVSIEFHDLSCQIGAHVIASAPAGFCPVRESDDHPDRKTRITRTGQVFPECDDDLGIGSRGGKAGLVTQNPAGGVAEMRRKAVEYHGAVCRHGREAAQSAFRFGAEPAESIDQGKIHRSFRLLRSDTLGDRLALSLVQPDLEACATPAKLHDEAEAAVAGARGS